jgi:hypothetical protein
MCFSLKDVLLMCGKFGTNTTEKSDSSIKISLVW